MCKRPTIPPNEIATRESWKILLLPEIRADLGFTESYTAEDFERIQRGFIPQEMEDKWFVFYEEPWLYLHRSWTGNCIYGVRFQVSNSEVVAVESWVSRDAEHDKETRIEYDRALLTFLIDTLLLGKPTPFPVPSDLPAHAPSGLYQHAVVGLAAPETKHLASERRTPSLGEWFRRWFRRD